MTTKPRDTLFKILCRSPWWISLAIAAAQFAGVRMFLPDIAAFFAALPFLGIAGYSAYKQLRAPSAARIAKLHGELRQMPWDTFRPLVEAALRRQGYAVEPMEAEGADIVATRQGSRTLVLARRWKAAQIGLQPLQTLAAAMEKHDARHGMALSNGEFSTQAKEFAAPHIELIGGDALARWLVS